MIREYAINKLVNPSALQAIFLRLYCPLAAYGLACLLIYMGLWTTAPRDIPSHLYDEPVWLRYSIRAEATFGSQYPDQFEINYSSSDQLGTSAYVIASARQLSGIPAEAVKRYSPNEPIDQVIRTSIVQFMTGLSSLGLLILFFWLQRSYGYGPSFVVLSLLVSTPFWQVILRRIMAEPSLFFFSVLALGSTLWLIQLLSSTRQHPLPLLLCAAGSTGLWIGLATGTKMTGALLFIGLIFALITLGRLTLRHYSLLIWLSAVAFLVAVGSFVLTNPFLWHPDMLERLQMAITFRSAHAIVQTTIANQAHLVDMATSLRTALFDNSFSQGRYNILPTLLSIPLCLLGLWQGFAQRSSLARASHAWLLSIGLVNALIVPLNWGRYFLYTVLAVHVFTGVGAWVVVKAVRERVSPLDVQLLKEGVQGLAALPSRRYGLFSKISAAVCIICATSIVLTLGVSSLQLSRERKLWEEYVFADHPAEQIEIINQIVQYRPQARYVGAPLLAWLQRSFQAHHQSLDPRILKAVYTSGKLLQTYSQDNDLRARVAYDMQQMLVPAAESQAPGQIPVVLNSIQTRASSSVSASVPALHDIDLVLQNNQSILQQVKVTVDGMPLGGLLTLPPDTSSALRLPPIYLTPGQHEVTLDLVPNSSNHSAEPGVTWEQLKLIPRYPSVNDITPSEFGRTGQQFVVLTNTTQVSSTWKWYDNFYLYGFYNIHIFGSTSDIASAQLIVSIDDQLVGTVTLDRYGAAALPLAVELANGATHTISIQPTNLADEARAYLYAVQIEKYEGPPIFAGSSMRWDKQYNHIITTSESVVHLPPEITLTKEVSIETADVYNVTVRYRVPQPANTQPQFHFDIGGWPIAQTAIPATPDWMEHTFTTYLTEGNHKLQFWWQDDRTNGIVDIMHVIVIREFLLPSRPEAQYSIGFVFDGKVEFVGYDIDKRDLKPGEFFHISYYWHLLRKLDGDYSIPVHFVHKTEGWETRFQQDHIPVHGRYPTTMWQPGDFIKETYKVTVPGDLPDGEYEMFIGLWHPPTQAWLAPRIKIGSILISRDSTGV